MKYFPTLRSARKNFGTPKRPTIFYPLLFGLLVILFAIELYRFAHVQDLWVDETTQLSGIRLSFFDMLRWLAGSDVARLGVPSDRMPPLSYVVDWMWVHLSGSGEVGLRLFHAAFVFGGVVGLAAMTWYVFGPIQAIIVLAFMVLSPKMIQMGVEIRAYPIFIAVTCAQAAIFMRLANNRFYHSSWELGLFAVLCLVAIYTHFFGVVSTGAFATALVISQVEHRGRCDQMMLIFGTICVVGALGILPFALAAANHSGVMTLDHKAREKLFDYFFKLLADSPNMVSLTAAALFFAGAFALLAASISGFYFRMRMHRLESADWAFVVVIVGVAATVTASFFIKTFNALSASYNVWTFPLLAIVASAGWRFWAGYCLWWDIGRKIATGALLTGSALSAYVFFSHPLQFVHGPREFIMTLYDKMEGPKAIVYEPGSQWGFAYFPLFFSRGGRIDQYLPVGRTLKVIRPDGMLEQDDQGLSIDAVNYRMIFVVDLRLRTYADIRRCIDGVTACPQFTSSVLDKMFTESGRWRERMIERQFGLYDTQVRILQNVSETRS